MSILDVLKKETKSPEFSVSTQYQWDDYSDLVDSQNYFDQYFGWTYKAIKTVADAVSSYDIPLYRKFGEQEIELDKKFPLVNDLLHFNDYMTLRQARALTITHRRLSGLAFWYIVDSDNPNNRYDFYILDPTRVSVVVNNFGLPEYYKYRDANGQYHNIDREDIIEFKDPDPKNWIRGKGVLQATRYPHNTWELASKFNMNFFGNNAKPEGFLVLDGISRNEKKRIENELKDKYGGVDNAGKLGILNRMAQFIGITSSQKDLDFTNGLVTMREEILAIHGVPKPLVGLTDSTFSNSLEAQRIFQRYTVKPELLAEEDVYNEQLIKKYFDTSRSVDIYFKSPDPVEADEQVDSNVAVALYQGGIITLNEAREKVGYGTMDDGDELKKPQQLPTMALQNTNDGNNENMPEKDSDDNEKSLKGIKNELKRVQMSIKSIPSVKEAMLSKRVQLKQFFADKFDGFEDRFVKIAQEYFDVQEKRVTQEVFPKSKKAISLDFEFDYKNEVQIAIDTFAPIFNDVAYDANLIANELAGGNVVIDEAGRKLIDKNLDKFAKEINKTTKDKITELVADGIEKQLSVEEIKNVIAEQFNRWAYGDGVIETRAKAMARTSVTGVFNQMSRRNYAENEYVKGFEWLSAHDRFVRDAHAEADGQQVVKGQKFNVGGEYLTAPGDPSGSAGNVINCRCTIIPVII
ncbi:MAG TPA: phage portal protein [Paludibacteraceae bacterium]|nr:phage portal protein [Paludibacteraceae bacterium]